MSALDLKLCRCMNSNGSSMDVYCVPMPNRFRKTLQAKCWWDEGVTSTKTDVWAQECRDAIAAEVGVDHEVAWCLTMEPVIMRVGR